MNNYPPLLQSLIENVQGSFAQLWLVIADIFPNVVEGLFILILGWVVAKIVSWLVGKIVAVIRLNQLMETAGVKTFFQKAGMKLNIEVVFKEVSRWFVLIAFFMSAASAFGLPQINDFLGSVLNYIPNVIIAALITIAGILIANFVADLAHGTTKATKSGSPQFVSTIVRYAVIVFTVIVALGQLQIGGRFLESFFDNLGLALAAAFGLAFGLGGKNAAADAIKKIRKDLSGEKK